jgi:phosphoglycolate phosphatase-like HAD superfamily hydrolase
MATTERVDAQAELARFQRDTDYFLEHYDELLREYPEHWVGIYEGQVTAAPEFRELLGRLRERGVPGGRAFIQFLTHKPEVLIV